MSFDGIRPGVGRDREEVARLAAACLGRYGPAARAAARWLVHPTVVTLIAEVEGGVAGFVQIGLVPGRDPRGGLGVEVLLLAVDPPRRRGGLGRKLMAAAIEKAGDLTTRQARARVALTTAADNQAARSLFRSLGFVETGVRRAYYGAGRDGVRMVAWLERAEAGDSPGVAPPG